MKTAHVRRLFPHCLAIAGMGIVALLMGVPPSGLTPSAFAQDVTEPQRGRVSDLPIPRFVSLRTQPVNMRTGPGIRYPVTWVYQRRTLPVEVTDEFDTWRRVRDPDGAEGWVHQSMLSGQRTGILKGPVSPLYKGSTFSSAVVAQLSPEVVMTIDRCPQQVDFCLVEAGGRKGWLQRGLFWGLYDGEIVE